MQLLLYIFSSVKQKHLPARQVFETDLFFHDLQHFHGASLHTNAAGNALGHGHFRLMYHDLHGANLNALAAAHAILLVDHVNTGLGILGNGLVLTGLHALTALDADIRLCTAILAGYDLDAGIIRMELLVECLGAGTDTLQASHTSDIFLN